MDFEYDPKKSASNLWRHGIDFVDAQELWDVAHVVIPSERLAGELRYALVGKLEDRLYVVIYTIRGSRIRLISCHRASGRWESGARGWGGTRCSKARALKLP